MLFSNPFSSVLLVSSLFVPGPLWATPATLSACLEEGKNQYTARQYQQAQKIFEQCLKMDSEIQMPAFP